MTPLTDQQINELLTKLRISSLKTKCAPVANQLRAPNELPTNEIAIFKNTPIANCVHQMCMYISLSLSLSPPGVQQPFHKERIAFYIWNPRKHATKLPPRKRHNTTHINNKRQVLVIYRGGGGGERRVEPCLVVTIQYYCAWFRS